MPLTRGWRFAQAVPMCSRAFIANLIDSACEESTKEAEKFEGGKVQQAWKDGYASGCANADTFRRDLAAKVLLLMIKTTEDGGSHLAEEAVEYADEFIAELAKEK